MTSQVNLPDGFMIRPLVNVIRDAFSSSPIFVPLKFSLYVLNSNALTVITATGMKSLAALVLSNQKPIPSDRLASAITFIISNLTPRIVYIEAAVICVATAVYNLFFTSLFLILNVATLGVSIKLRSLCTESLIHAALSVSSCVVALIGFFNPQWGIVATIGLWAASFHLINVHVGTSCAKYINGWFLKNKKKITDSLKGATNNARFVNQHISPLVLSLTQLIEVEIPKTTNFYEILKKFIALYRAHPVVQSIAIKTIQQIWEEDLNNGFTRTIQDLLLPNRDPQPSARAR